jgi:uncharacterized protein YneF (UPF0154 family)
MRFRLFSLPACLLLAASAAFAEGVVIIESHGPAQGTATSAAKIHIEGDRLFVETQQDGGKQGVIFLGDSKVMRMLDFSNNTYREMTEQDFERLGDSMAQMRQMMEEKLKNMPPQQRQMVEQMMKQKMGAMPGAGQAPSRVVYTKVASGQTVRQWSCDKYEGTRDSEKVWEVCAVDFAEFGVEPSDLRVFQQMAEMVKSMAPKGMEDSFQIGFDEQQAEQGFRGVPVERLSFRNGAPHQKYQITEVTRQDIDDALFEVPPGFKKVEMPQMGRPQR